MLKHNYIIVLGAILLYLMPTSLSYAQSWKKLYKEAKALADSAKYKEAIPIYEKALERIKKKNKHYAKIINSLGLVYNDNGESNKAKPLIEEALGIREKIFGKSSPEYALNLNDLGVVYESLDNYSKAIEYHQKSLAVRFKLSDSLDIAQSLSNLGVCHSKAGAYPKSKELFEQSIDIYEQKLGKKHEKYLGVLSNYAVLTFRMGDLDKTKELFYNLAELQKDVFGKKHPKYARTLSNLGGVYYRTGEVLSAIKVLNQALEIQSETLGKGHPDYALTLNNLAAIYYQRTEYVKAQRLLEESLEIIEKNKGESSEAYARGLENLATMYSNLKDYKQALKLYEQSLNIRQTIFGKKHSKYAGVLHNIGATFSNLGNLTKAQEYLEEALKVKQEIHKVEFHRSYETTYNTLGMIASSQKNYKKAIELYEKSLKCIATNTTKKHINYFKALNNLVSVNFKLNNTTTSDSLLSTFFEDAKKVLSDKNDVYMAAEGSMVEHYIQKKQWQNAEKLSLKLRQKFKEKYGKDDKFIIARLAKVYAKKSNIEKQRIPEAGEVINKLAHLLKEDLAQTFRFLSELEQKKYFQKNLPLIESFFVSTINYTSQDSSFTTKLYNFHLNTKGILLNNSAKMRKNIFASKDSTLIRDFEQWQDQKTLISRVNLMSVKKRKQQGWDLDSLQEITNDLEKNLVSRSQDFAQTYAPKSVTWQDVQRTLKAGEVVVELKRIAFVKEDTTEKKPTQVVIYAAFIVSAETLVSPEIVLIREGKKLETDYIDNYYYQLNTRTKDLQSYQYFWLPIQQKLNSLGKFSKVYFSADGVYHELNLNTLYNPKTKKHLYEEINIQQINSGKSLLKSPRKSNPSTSTALVMGRPQYDLSAEEHKKVSQNIIRNNTFDWSLGKFEDLPATETEVNEITQTLSNVGYTVDKKLGKEALEEVLKYKLNQPQVLHLATHGFFEKPKSKTITEQLNATFDEEQEAMLNAGLVFTGVNTYLNSEEKYDTEDGVLTALEVTNLDLDATELVVLSACNTAQGRIVNGEGVYGLQRAFQVAGAQNILMSLWKVDDKATAILISNFYENWVNSGSASESLSKAQTYLRNYTIKGKKKYAHPYFWGAFVLLEN